MPNPTPEERAEALLEPDWIERLRRNDLRGDGKHMIVDAPRWRLLCDVVEAAHGVRGDLPWSSRERVWDAIAALRDEVERDG